MLWNIITSSAKKIEAKYKAAGYPLVPITGLIRRPMRSYYHLSPLLRHDSKFYFKPFVLKILHYMLVVNHPRDFKIYGDKILFRSYGSFMSVQGYYVGEVEHHLVKFVVNRMKPGFVMLDVGAHHGIFTIPVAYELKVRGWKGAVHSFEPLPLNFSILTHNVVQNKLQKYVVLHNEAVSDKKGKQKFILNPEENSDGQLGTVNDMQQGQFQNGILEHEVKVVNLDSLLKSVKRVNLIKMDVQGAELFTLQGAEAMLKRDKPVLVIEAVKGWPSTREIIKFLIKHRYTLHGVNAKGELCPYDSPDVYVSWDLIGLPRL